MNRFARQGHDHDRCRRVALDRAERLCRGRRVRLTAQRRKVLELVWESHAPVGAYALLERLREAGVGAAPPTVYRALDFLVEQDLVHRIESLNAYVGCALPAGPHQSQFLICSRCGNTAELSDPVIGGAIDRAVDATGFEPESSMLEVFGTCPDCRAQA